MREIKFRAWDNEGKSMHMVEEITFDKNIIHGLLVDVQKRYFFNEKCLVDGRYIDDVILMQYTGYKDRNGREVYEGDIYAMEKYRHGEKTVTYWAVIWDETEYGFSLVANIEKSYMGEKYREDVYLPLRAIDGNRMEYAGNIYENPELVSWM